MITSNHWAPWPPIYVVAYMSPQSTEEERDAEIETIAKFPMAIVGQSINARPWYERIRAINSDIVLLAYQMIAQDRTHITSGPGNVALAPLVDPWMYDELGQPKIFPAEGTKLYDYRKCEWKTGIRNAVDAILDDGFFNGIFFDNCTAFALHAQDSAGAFNPIVHAELLAALQVGIDGVRADHPNIPIIGNTSRDLVGINGEMNEGRFEDLIGEVTGDDHQKPNLNVYLHYVANEQEFSTIRPLMETCFENKVHFAAQINAQTYHWLPEFDEVMSQWRRLAPPRRRHARNRKDRLT